MQRQSCNIGNCITSLRCYLFPNKSILLPSTARRYTTRKPAGFASNSPPSAVPRSHGSKPQKIPAGRTSTKAEQESPDETTQTGRSWKFPIGPGKLIFFSLFAYTGYRVYTWQTNPRRSRVLDPRNFTPFILETRTKVSSTSSILNLLSLPRGQNTDNVAEAWRSGIWSVEAMQPELQIARAYTPLPPKSDAEPEQLRLFVRKEPRGEVSSFLHRISRGTLVHLRGPQIEYNIPEDVEEVLFLAGGTGIAPALQVAHVLYNYRLSSSAHQPKLRILWANRHREDSHNDIDPLSLAQSQAAIVPGTQEPSGKSLKNTGDEGRQSKNRGSDLPFPPQNPLVEEVNSLKARYPGSVSVEYFVDDEGSHITENVLRDYLAGIERVSQLSSEDQPTRNRLVLISGPDGFVDFYAGPKSIKGGREIQGPLGGILQKIGPRDWEIWKL